MKRPTAQQQIQAATGAGKIPVVIHNGRPCFATWDAEKGAVHYEPCPPRHPRAQPLNLTKGKP